MNEILDFRCQVSGVRGEGSDNEKFYGCGGP